MTIAHKTPSVLAKLAALSPFVAGPLFDHIPPFKIFLAPYLERYFYFLALFVAWNAFLYFITKFYLPRLTASKQPASTAAQSATPFPKSREALKLFALLVLVALVILSLDFFQKVFPQPVFHLALFACGAVAIKNTAQLKQKIFLPTIAEWAYLSSAAYLSFLMTSLNWRWQPILISIGLGSIAATRPLAFSLNRFEEKPATSSKATSSNQEAGAKKFTWVYRCHSLLTVLAPTMLGCLCYLGQLPRPYLATFLVLALFYRMPDPTKQPRAVKSPLQLFLYRTDLALSLYVVILIILAIL